MAFMLSASALISSSCASSFLSVGVGAKLGLKLDAHFVEHPRHDHRVGGVAARHRERHHQQQRHGRQQLRRHAHQQQLVQRRHLLLTLRAASVRGFASRACACAVIISAAFSLSSAKAFMSIRLGLAPHNALDEFSRRCWRQRLSAPDLALVGYQFSLSLGAHVACTL